MDLQCCESTTDSETKNKSIAVQCSHRSTTKYDSTKSVQGNTLMTSAKHRYVCVFSPQGWLGDMFIISQTIYITEN